MQQNIQDYLIAKMQEVMLSPDVAEQWHWGELKCLLMSDTQYIEIFDTFTHTQQVDIFLAGLKHSAWEFPMEPGTSKVIGPMQWVGHRFEQAFIYYTREWGKVVKAMPRREQNKINKPSKEPKPLEDPNVVNARREWKEAVAARDAALLQYSQWISPVRLQLEALELQLKGMYEKKNEHLAPLEAKVIETRAAFRNAKQ